VTSAADIAPVTAAADVATAPGRAAVARSEPFRVRLDGFDGPFDLLLGLIAKHELDVTRIALAKVTDDFLVHLRRMEAAGGWDLDRVSEFVVVAATLLDLKAARLLPRGEVEDAEDIAALEAREMLFVRLLQYRAYRRVADTFAARFATEGVRVPASVGPGPEFDDVLPVVLLGLDAARFAELARRVFAPRPPEVPDTAHLHAPTVSVAEQSRLLGAMLREAGTLTFTQIAADTDVVAVVVARFLALLEMFRDGLVVFDQPVPLGSLAVAWTGSTVPTEIATPAAPSGFDDPVTPATGKEQ
jgi:segregation and condensation protein A